MQNIDKSFFGNPANKDISLEVNKGEIHALLGENGAGKTTLMNILYGIYPRDSGIILWKDEEVNFTAPMEAIQNKIGMVHQHFMLVPTMTVSENITLGLKSTGHPFPNRRKLNKSIKDLSGKYGLNIDPEKKISDLSVGEEQRVEIIKLLYKNAELLILDEPTAVLTPQETESFFTILKRLKSEGHSVILITHKIPEVLAVTDRITVLRDGCKVAGVKTSEIDSIELSRLMIGRDLNPVTRNNKGSEDKDLKPRLIIENLSYSDQNLEKLHNITLTLRVGEILGIAGVDGNGQKELAECLIGIVNASRGKIKLDDSFIEKQSIAARKEMGLTYISDDRHHDGLILDMDLVENFLLKSDIQKDFTKFGFINYKKCRSVTEESVTSYNIKTPGTEVPISLLSGGNQQKLILARELSGNPSVIVAFQPTRGLDIGASEFIRKQLVELAEKGCSVLLISTDMDEILSLSNRIAVMYEGKMLAIMKNETDIDMTRIGLLMAGQEEKRGGAK
jgi:simple sugar transport system ATP-binding protein